MSQRNWRRSNLSTLHETFLPCFFENRTSSAGANRAWLWIRLSRVRDWITKWRHRSFEFTENSPHTVRQLMMTMTMIEPMRMWRDDEWSQQQSVAHFPSFAFIRSRFFALFPSFKRKMIFLHFADESFEVFPFQFDDSFITSFHSVFYLLMENGGEK